MSAWPHFVPRVELDVHLKAIQVNVDEIFRRLGDNDERGVSNCNSIESLHARSKELADKTELNHMRSKLDLQVACCQAELVDGLAEVREYAAAEAARVRTDVEAQMETLRSSLTAASQHTNRLEAALEEAASFNAATYVTKAGHKESLSMLQLAQENLSSDLSGRLDNLSQNKASRTEINNAKEELRDAETRIDKQLAATSMKLAQTTSNLAELEKHCQTLAPMAFVTQMDARLADVKGQAASLAETQLNLWNQCNFDRERIVANISEVQQNWSVLNDAVDSIRHLQVSRSSLTERVDRCEQEGIVLNDRLNKHWDQNQQEFENRRKAQDNLEGACTQLRLDLHGHKEAQKIEGDRLKQHSTMRYLDQIDKALMLEQKVNRVDRGHVDLQVEIATIRNPKHPMGKADKQLPAIDTSRSL